MIGNGTSKLIIETGSRNEKPTNKLMDTHNADVRLMMFFKMNMMLTQNRLSKRLFKLKLYKSQGEDISTQRYRVS